ncbi:MAG: SDR family oxidoreductase [Bacteroidia bacterium]|nr:SDR family oxidoreductase [Bacteroidia bacterium]
MESPGPTANPKQVLVIGATGRAGRRLVEYSLEKGHHVTAFARNIDQFDLKHQNLRKVQGDVLYKGLIDAAVKGQDIVLSVIGIRQFRGPITLMSEGMKNIIRSMEEHSVKRLLTITGAGILQEDEEMLIMDSLSFPPNLQNLSLDHKRVWKLLKASTLDWTIVCPAFMHSGEKTGNILVEKNAYPRKAQNDVSVEDVAEFITEAMLDPTYVGSRVGIAHPIV